MPLDKGEGVGSGGDSTFEMAGVGIAHLNAEGRLIAANAFLARMLAYPRDALVGMHYHDLSHPEDRHVSDPLRQRLLAREIDTYEVEKRYLRGDGVTIHVHIAVSAVWDAAGRYVHDIGVFHDVTERWRAQQALAHSERRYRALIENSAEGIVLLDAQRRIIYGSPGAGRILGYQDDDLRGAFGADMVHEEDRKAFLRALDTAVSRPGIAVDARARLRHRDGSYRLLEGSWTNWLGEPGIDALVANFRDITERDENERRFRALVQSSPDAILVHDGEHVLLANPAALKLFHARSLAELIGRSPVEMVAGGQVEVARERIARLIAGEPVPPMEQTWNRLDGSTVEVEVRASPLQFGGARLVQVIGRDISARRRADTENRQLLHTLGERVKELRALHRVADLLRVDGLSAADALQAVADAIPPALQYPAQACARVSFADQVRTTAAYEPAPWVLSAGFICADGSSGAVEARYRELPAGAPSQPFLAEEQDLIASLAEMLRSYFEREHARLRLRAHAERQEAIARFGHFALGRSDPDWLFDEAVRAACIGRADAALALEFVADSGQFVVRAARGEGAEKVIGSASAPLPDSVWPRMIRDKVPRIVGYEHLARRADDRPWSPLTRGMGSGAYVPVYSDDEPTGVLAMYSRAEQAFDDDDTKFLQAIGSVLSAALQRNEAESRLSQLAQFDALTGLPNRNLLHDRITQLAAQARRGQRHAGVLFVDLDRFKLINDTLGHQQGDALIALVSRRLMQCVRAGDTVGRISGDEFAVVLAELASPDDAAPVARKVLEALSQPYDLEGSEAYVTASIGIAVFPQDGETAEALLTSADMAMYRAKEQSRNAYCFFTADLNQRSAARMQLGNDLRRAIERREFRLHYQPKIELASGRICGLEALLRWAHPQRGAVSPVEFIPALEDSGLIIPVGAWVIEEACGQLRTWMREGRVPVPVAVNLSPRQFHRGELDTLIRRELARAGVPARLLELEITESCLMQDPEDAVRVMDALRDAGLGISIDDFGTGYSSLSYLRRLPLAALKIDRSFVSDAHVSADAASIVRSIIDMAHNLRLKVIAEGVETEVQAAFLRAHGCDQGQGYLFGRPVPAADIRLDAATEGRSV